jgi:hypothetical protein
MLQIIRELPKPKGKLRWLVWVRWYCQCQKQGCRPCPNWPVIFAKTENGDLQLCKKYRWEYAVAAMRQFSAKVTDALKGSNCSPLCSPNKEIKANMKVQ